MDLSTHRRPFPKTFVGTSLLLTLLASLTLQQSFLEQLQRQQEVQLEQQGLQGQLQELALHHQAAKDVRNEEKVTRLEIRREMLLARMQDLQDELQRLLHGSSPRKPAPQSPKTEAHPNGEHNKSIASDPNQLPTALSQEVQETEQLNQQQPLIEPQEEVFQIPEDFNVDEAEEFQQQEEVPIFQEIEGANDTNLKLPENADDQLQRKEIPNRITKVNDNSKELHVNPPLTHSTSTPVPLLRITILKDDQRGQQRRRKQLWPLHFIEGTPLQDVLRKHNHQPPHTFGFAPINEGSFGSNFQSFGQVSPSFSHVQFFQPSHTTPEKSFVQDQFSILQGPNNRRSEALSPASHTFSQKRHSFTQSSTAELPGKLSFSLEPGSIGLASFDQTFGQPSQTHSQVNPTFISLSVIQEPVPEGQHSFAQSSSSSSQSFHAFGQSNSFSQSSTSLSTASPLTEEVIQIVQPFTTIEQLEEQEPISIQVSTVPPPCTSVTGAAGECRPLVQCLTFYLEITTLSQSRCPLSIGADGTQQLGVCCPFKGQAEIHTGPPLDRRQQGVLLPPPPPRVQIPPFSQQQLSNAANEALRRIQERIQATAFIFSQGVFIPPLSSAPSPAGKHQEHFFALTPGGNTVKKAEDGQKNVEASVSLVEEFKLTPAQGAFALPTFSILSTIIGDSCPRRPDCPGLDSDPRFTKYRTADGRCNNLRNGEWGGAGVALQRILPPKYGDGVNSPRVADGVTSAEANSDGGTDGLPGARVVSTQFAGASSPNAHSSHEHTLILMQWGQFLDHDLTHTPISRGNGGGISCCRDGKALLRSSNLRHPDCYAIPIPGDDPFFGQFRETCMEFVRSLPAPRPQCNFGPREQMNQVTGYIDASNVYGSSESSQRALREFSGGRLKVQKQAQPGGPQRVSNKGLLPGDRDICTDDFDEKECFAAGDTRANEQPELAVMHTLWVREHNRVARALSEFHPNWSDEALFQEARRIVAAEMQHITYNEFLPIILGKEYMDKFELTPLVTRGGNHTHLYDADLNAGITNVFATAAFRFGHSLIQGNILGFTKFGAVKRSLQLSKNQFSPFTLYEDGAVDDFVRGLSTQTCQRFDRFFTPELTNHLFQGDLPFGLDLVALNIQRGREHGLAPYPDWREACGYKKPTKWEDLLEIMERETVEVLRGIYTSVSEIDLFIGGVGEKGGLGGSSSLLGPTFACLIGDQFARLRRGDRFYYEEGDQPSSFTQRQLEQLRRTSLARILCDNADDVGVMQPLAFFKATYLNQRVPCESGAIPTVNLRAWADEIPAVA